MTSSLLRFATLAVLLLSAMGTRLCASEARAQETAPPSTTEKSPSTPEAENPHYTRTKIPMRDGVLLNADVSLPPGKGPFPVILSRSPYGDTKGPKNGVAKSWIERGYAFVAVDTRGKLDSEGQCAPGYDEINDGFDTLEWISNQSWSNQNVGMVGGSYVALTQLAAAASGHKTLKAVAPSAISGSLYDCYYNGGALLMSFMPTWHIGMSFERSVKPDSKPDWAKLRSEFPVSTLDERAGMPSPSWKDLVRHPFYDDYWKKNAFASHVSKVRTPMFIQASWFDLLGRKGIQIYQALMDSPDVPLHVKNNSFLRIGPWGHGVNVKEGLFEFGDSALVTEDEELDFLMSLLQGQEPALRKAPGKIAYFTMGRNQWQYTDVWPPANTHPVPFYLSSAGNANSRSGDGLLALTLPDDKQKPDSYRYEPENPVPTCGGRMVGSGGQKDQSEIEDRTDVLVYTLPVLDEDLEITGEVWLKLFAASSAPDTDFTAKLVDVRPDGTPLNVCDGILRVRYRNEKNAKEELLTPGTIYELDVYLDVTSYRFKKGHRVRLEVSSSNFPHYTRNPNMAKNPLENSKTSPAIQTIHHANPYPSRLILPVVKEPVKKVRP